MQPFFQLDTDHSRTLRVACKYDVLIEIRLDSEKPRKNCADMPNIS